MQQLLKKSQQWVERHQEAFDSVKQALVDATVLAAPNEEGQFVLATDTSAVAIADILHQEQEHNGKTVLRPIVYGQKSQTRTQLNYGAPILEMYAVLYFIEKFHSYLVGGEFTLRVDNQALSWLKTYSMDRDMFGRWIARLDQYHFKTIHRPRTQHRNADGLSMRTVDHVHRERIIEKLPEVSKGFNFMSQRTMKNSPSCHTLTRMVGLDLATQSFLRKLELKCLYCTFYGRSQSTNQRRNKRVASHGTPKYNGRQPQRLTRMIGQVTFSALQPKCHRHALTPRNQILHM